MAVEHTSPSVAPNEITAEQDRIVAPPKDPSCLFVWPEDTSGRTRERAEFSLMELQDMGVSVHEVVSPTLSTINRSSLNGAGKGVTHVVWVVAFTTDTRDLIDSSSGFNVYIDPERMRSEVEALRTIMRFDSLIVVAHAELLADSNKRKKDGLDSVRFTTNIDEVPNIVSKNRIATPYNNMTKH